MTIQFGKLKISTDTSDHGAPKRYHFDPLAGLAYLSAPGFATMFVVFGHRWFLIAAALSIAAGALRASFVQQNLPPASLPEGTPVTNGGAHPVGIVTGDGIKPIPKEEMNGPTAGNQTTGQTGNNH